MYTADIAATTSPRASADGDPTAAIVTGIGWVADVAQYLEIERDELMRQLFGDA